MRNPRPICPNPACINHNKPPAGFYRKRGYYKPKHNNQPVPRYQCKACGKLFSATQTKPIAGHHRPDINSQVFKLAVSGVSMRRMKLITGCSRTTISLKITHLSNEGKKKHAEHMKSMQTAHVMMDELETFVHARWKQLSVSVVVRVKTGEVLGFAVARKPSNMKQGIQGNKWIFDGRPQAIQKLLFDVAPCLKAGATIATDKHTSYGKWIAQTLPSVQHQRFQSPIGPDYDPLFAINLAFAKMRNDLARLGRKTWTTTKSIKALEEHLWLWVAWTNGYSLR